LAPRTFLQIFLRREEGAVRGSVSPLAKLVAGQQYLPQLWFDLSEGVFLRGRLGDSAAGSFLERDHLRPARSPETRYPRCQLAFRMQIALQVVVELRLAACA